MDRFGEYSSKFMMPSSDTHTTVDSPTTRYGIKASKNLPGFLNTLHGINDIIHIVFDIRMYLLQYACPLVRNVEEIRDETSGVGIV